MLFQSGSRRRPTLCYPQRSPLLSLNLNFSLCKMGDRLWAHLVALLCRLTNSQEAPRTQITMNNISLPSRHIFLKCFMEKGEKQQKQYGNKMTIHLCLRAPAPSPGHLHRGFLGARRGTQHWWCVLWSSGPRCAPESPDRLQEMALEAPGRQGSPMGSDPD